MARYAYYEEAADETPITPEDVDGCKDLATLESWLYSLESREDAIKAQLEARKEAETDDDEWAQRAGDALGYVKMGVRRIKRRMRALGHDAESHGRHIQALHDRIAGYKAKEARWLLDRKFIEAAEQALPADQFAALLKKAAAGLAALTEIPEAA
jgi:hypothetical protein